MEGVCDAVLGRHYGGMGYRQVAVTRGVYRWREERARGEDVSPGVVLSNAAVVRVGYGVPREEEELVRLCGPGYRGGGEKGVEELLEVVRRAAEEAVEGEVPGGGGVGGGSGGGVWGWDATWGVCF